MKTTLINMLRGTRAVLMMSMMAVPVCAKVAAPVMFSLGTADTIKPGEPLTVHVWIQPGADIQQAQFSLRSSADWQVAGGTSYWVGALAKGQPVEFQFQAIPLRADPGALVAVLSIPGYADQTAAFDPERTGGRFPEKAAAHADKTVRKAATEEEPVQVNFDPGEFIPEPLPATEPRVPGQAAQPQPPVVNPKAGKGRTARVNLTANGRFTYDDDNDLVRGVRFASVEVWNLNPFPSFGDELCGRSTTDGAGNFTVTGACGDWSDGPDLVARIILNNNVIEVKPDNLFAGSYTFQSAAIQNSGGGTVNFGRINITSNRGAYAVHNLATRAQRFMAEQGEGMSKVTVLFPAQATFYTPVLANLSIAEDRAFGEVASVFHEYAHHVLVTKAESPSPDYENGHCDDPNPGHCIGEPEKGVISWTEGFPNFFAAMLHRQFRTADGYPANTKYASESSPDPADFDFPGEEDKTEGVISAILWDLFDTASDDQNPDAPGSDRISLPFSVIWQVIRTFDPSGDLFHNHPTSIHEFWQGLRAQRLNDINRVSEVYGQHNIPKPQPDIEVTALQNPPQAVAPGLQFNVNNTIANTGNERANSGFTVRFELRPSNGLLVSRTSSIPLGSRSVGANLLAGSQSTAQTSLQVPAGAALGTYVLRVCSDTGGAVPESDEGNNCRLATTTTIIR